MAAVTLLGTQTFNTTTGTHTVAATPAIGDLIIIVAANTGYTGTSLPTDNNSDGLGTYTLITSSVKATSADTLQFYVRNSLVGAAASTTFSMPGASSTGGGLGVFKITGMPIAGTEAIRQSAIQSNQAASTTPTPVLSKAALTSNALIGAVFNATSAATMTPRTSYTEAFDVGYSTPTTGLETMFRSSGETSTSIAWGSTSASAFCDGIVEINATDMFISVNDASTITDVPVVDDGDIYLVQAPTATKVGSAVTINYSLAQAPQVGNYLVIAMASSGPNSPITSFTDNQSGNTYTQIGATETTAGGSVIQTFAGLINSSSGTFTLSATGTGGGTAWSSVFCPAEWGNVSNIDKTGGTTGTSTTPTTTSMTPSVNKEILYAAFTDDAADNTTITADTGYRLLQSQLLISTSNRVGTEFQFQTTAAAVTPSFTIGTSASWAINGLTLKPAIAVSNLSLNVSDNSAVTDVISSLYIYPLSVNVFNASAATDTITMEVTNNIVVSDGSTYLIDDFSGTLSNWTQSAGTWTTSNGTLISTANTGSNWGDDIILSNTTSYTDFEILTDVKKGSANDQIVFRSGATFGTGYGIQIRDVANFRLENWGSASLQNTTNPGSLANWSTGTWYSVRIRVQGNHIQARIWLQGTTEPTSWYIDYTDASNLFSSGAVGFSNENNIDAGYDNFYLYTLITESTSVVTNLNINVLDNSTVTNVITQILVTGNINVFDASTATDVPTVIPQIPGLSLFDSSAVTDSLTKILLTSNINVFDSSVVTDVPIIQIPTYYINTSDASTITDSLLQILDQEGIVIFDTTTATDVLTVILQIPGLSLFDSSTATDVLTQILVKSNINVFDTSAATDIITQILPSISINVFDASAATDVITQILTTDNINISDSSAATDVLTQIMAMENSNVFDSSTVIDTPTVTISTPAGPDLAISVGEDTAATDALTVQIPIYFVSVSDSSSVTEAVTVIPQIPGLSVFDGSTVTDAPTMLLIANVVTQEASTVTDSVTLLSQDNISVHDASAATDVPVVRMLTNIAVFDGSTITEAITTTGTSFLTINDATIATDSLVVSIPTYFVSVSDSSTLSENIQTTGTIRLSVFDASAATDIPTIHLVDNSLLGISVFDAVGSPYPFIFVDGRMAIRLGGNQYTFL